MGTETGPKRVGALPRVVELASAPVVAVREDLDAMDALQEMYRSGLHHLAVISDDAPLGLVAAVDLLFGIAGRVPGERVRVNALCRRPAPVVDSAEDVAAAARRMVESGTDALLVMSEGNVRGVLTAVDVVRVVAEGRVAGPAPEADLR